MDGSCFEDGEGSGTAPAPFRVCYHVQDTALFSNALTRLPEFSRGLAANGEEFIWLAPLHGTASKSIQPVATIRLSVDTVEIESQSRKGLQAMQILIEELGGKQVRLKDA